MNANTLITSEMTLEQKLEAIDKAMANAVEEQKKQSLGTDYIPTDPSLLVMCESCQ